MRSTTLRVILLIAGATGSACAGPTPAEDIPGAALASATLPIADPGTRTVVARVNDRPIYDDCIVFQAAAHTDQAPHAALDPARLRRDALADCIEIELLAAAAEARGLVADPDVQAIRKTELARRFIDRDFTLRYPNWKRIDADLREFIYERFKRRYVHPELRDTSFWRAAAPIADAPAGSPTDLEAKRAAQAVYQALAGERNLTGERFYELAATVVEAEGITIRIESDNVPPFHRESAIVEPYRAATFAIAEAGIISPPFRTEWGWDVVLLRAIRPARSTSIDEAATELFPVARQKLYYDWSETLLTEAQTRIGPIAINHSILEALQAGEEASRFEARPVGP